MDKNESSRLCSYHLIHVSVSQKKAKQKKQNNKNKVCYFVGGKRWSVKTEQFGGI